MKNRIDDWSKWVLWIVMYSCLNSYSLNAISADFTFTAIPDQDTAGLQERFGKIADYLTKELRIPVKYIPVKSGLVVGLASFCMDK